jgi:hypothetical protein
MHMQGFSLIQHSCEARRPWVCERVLDVKGPAEQLVQGAAQRAPRGLQAMRFKIQAAPTPVPRANSSNGIHRLH